MGWNGWWQWWQCPSALFTDKTKQTDSDMSHTFEIFWDASYDISNIICQYLPYIIFECHLIAILDTFFHGNFFAKVKVAWHLLIFRHFLRPWSWGCVGWHGARLFQLWTSSRRQTWQLGINDKKLEATDEEICELFSIFYIVPYNKYRGPSLLRTDMLGSVFFLTMKHLNLR